MRLYGDRNYVVAAADFANSRAGHSEFTNTLNRPNILSFRFFVTELSILGQNLVAGRVGGG